MNLERHLSVLWRFRAVVVTGVLLGVMLAALASFKISLTGGGLPSVERRGEQVWSSVSDTFVTQPGFPWGRVTLPSQATGAPDAKGPVQQPSPSDRGTLEFADPTRFSNLAMLYSVIAHSDRVRARLPERPGPDQVEAQAFDATGNGTTFLPIIRLTTRAATSRGAQTLNLHAIDGLRDVLSEEQRNNGIEPNQRIRLNVLNAASKSKLISGPSLTPAFLALILATLGAVALVHILEALFPRRGGAAERGAEPAPLTAVGPIGPGSADNAAEARTAEASHRNAR